MHGKRGAMRKGGRRGPAGARHIILMETPCFLIIAALTRSLPALRPHSVIGRILVASRTQPSAARKSSFASGAPTCPLPLRLAVPAHIRNNMAVSIPSSCASSLSLMGRHVLLCSALLATSSRKCLYALLMSSARLMRSSSVLFMSKIIVW